MEEFSQVETIAAEETLVADAVSEPKAVQQLLFTEEATEENAAPPLVSDAQIKKLEEMELVMNKGMEFLSGLFKMSTGKELSANGNKIEIDRNTGEMVMRFKLNL